MKGRDFLRGTTAKNNNGGAYDEKADICTSGACTHSFLTILQSSVNFCKLVCYCGKMNFGVRLYVARKKTTKNEHSKIRITKTGKRLEAASEAR